jgi:hypothetical protein
MKATGEGSEGGAAGGERGGGCLHTDEGLLARGLAAGGGGGCMGCGAGGGGWLDFQHW